MRISIGVERRRRMVSFEGVLFHQGKAAANIFLMFALHPADEKGPFDVFRS